MPCRLIVSLTTTEPPLTQQIREALAAGADLIELRVDLIDDLPAVERLLRDKPCELIVTVRSRDEGGAFEGSEAERISLIERLGLLEPGWIDVELSAWRRSANLRQKVRLVAGVPDAGGRAADFKLAGPALVEDVPDAADAVGQLAVVVQPDPAGGEELDLVGMAPASQHGVPDVHADQRRGGVAHGATPYLLRA